VTTLHTFGGPIAREAIERPLLERNPISASFFLREADDPVSVSIYGVTRDASSEGQP
jgi:hypothetical protein